MRQASYELSITPLKNSSLTLAAVRTWYQWAIETETFRESFIQPEPGDLVLFDHLIEKMELDHIGIVIQNNPLYIITSEGNFYNSSGIFKRKKGLKIRGYIKL